MPYTLRLLYADSPLNSVAEAEAVIARESEVQPKGHLVGRYRSFQAGMVDNCPDLSDDDPNADRPDNAWPHGLPARFDSAVYSFSPNVPMLELGLLGLIAESVALHGLHMFDPQTLRLYRPDRVVIDRHGARSSPPPMERPAIARSALITYDQTDALVQPLKHELATRLAPFGLTPREPGPDGVGSRGFLRRVDRIVQNLQVTATHSHGGVTTHGRWALFVPEITEQWVPPLATEFERYFNAHQKPMGGRVDPFWVYSEDLIGAEGAAFGESAFAHSRTREPLARWFAAYGGHVIGKELPVLDRIGTPRDLARFAQRSLALALETGRDPSMVEAFGLLVLAFCFDRANFAHWHGSLRSINAIRVKTQGWDDPATLIDRLSAHLESPYFDPTRIGGDDKC
ncbi:MAG: hypothetical protein IPO66_16610 [Rhodanobacteraceae bacterium]|nr:hypothetical protein [Rhodanobacteraceae bacterium]